ncbi:glycogen debranching protein [bacterium]|nr:MAG: glycogen debranching protein [bacterium]
MIQTPSPGAELVRFTGDLLTVTLETQKDKGVEAYLRTTLGRAGVRRREIIDEVEAGVPRLDRDWRDLRMERKGPGVFSVTFPLLETGVFWAKAFCLPRGGEPQWPSGGNIRIKVISAEYSFANTIYSAFVRQHSQTLPGPAELSQNVEKLEEEGYTVIPPSGRFRDFSERIPFIVETLGFRIIQLLPVHPVPTTYGRMGRFGSPFASLDFMDTDPAMAEFDRRTTPLDQLRELVDKSHSLHAKVFLDIPVNHTGWASWLQIHHPEWFARSSDESFLSPGAWGVVWSDLSKLDYSSKHLWRYMAEVFLWWCRLGVDGFRCDAGYMVPVEAWRYMVAKVREEFPDTVFFLEGLGGPLWTMESLLVEAGLDWAYSELFQNYTRDQLDAYIPWSDGVSRLKGPLIHFAETHDNDRLAARSENYARMRCGLSALVSQWGGFGLTNGAEWLATKKIEVHEAGELNWGAAHNQVDWIAKLNTLLSTHQTFVNEAELKIVGCLKNRSALAVRRSCGGSAVLVIANLDTEKEGTVRWKRQDFPFDKAEAVDLLSRKAVSVGTQKEEHLLTLRAGEVLCLGYAHERHGEDFRALMSQRMARRSLLRLAKVWGKAGEITPERLMELESIHQGDPYLLCAELSGCPLPPVSRWRYPSDLRRVLPLPPGNVLLAESKEDFELTLVSGGKVLLRERAIRSSGGDYFVLVPPLGEKHETQRTVELEILVYGRVAARYKGKALLLGGGEDTAVTMYRPAAKGFPPRSHAILSNRRGTMAMARARWGHLESVYDAFLSANPSGTDPSDRWVFLRRCRAWLVYRGYSRELSAECMTGFAVDDNCHMAWFFEIPCGMGKYVRIEARLSILPSQNAVELKFLRPTGVIEEELPPDEPVAIIVRPDIEDRPCHGVTKAWMGAEARFPGAVFPSKEGFAFRPDPFRSFEMRFFDSLFTSEPEWLYNVAHPFEEGRGLESRSDLFSPGYFRMELRGDGVVSSRAWALFGGEGEPEWPAPVREGKFHREVPIAEALESSASAFEVQRSGSVSLLAGFPWFLDWGRDSLIAARGLIAMGKTSTAAKVITSFAAMEREGTLPNALRGSDSSNRDTSDAPLWLAVAAFEYAAATGNEDFWETALGKRTLREVIVSIAKSYIRGTPNSIIMDPATALVFSPAHYTWMDTNFPAGTPREGYPVEIQALWYKVLRGLSGIDGSENWAALAGQARSSILELFYSQKRGFMSDCLHAAPGQGAREGVPDDHLRPNQLFAVTLGAAGTSEAHGIIEACRELLVPGGMRSLADREVAFPLHIEQGGKLLSDPRHPYRGRYEGPEDFSRKPAYHNGTAWTFLLPSFCEALYLTLGECARAEALSLMSSCGAVMEAGCLGHVAEIMDGDAPHSLRGCGAQLWGATEAYRIFVLLKNRSRIIKG